MKISWPKGMERWKAVLERYRYALLVVAVGALLLLLPTGGTQPAAEERQTDRETFFQLEELEEKLARTLSSIHGAGETEVMLTLGRGSGSQVVGPLQTVAPQFRGALVVCAGGDDPGVRLQVIRAVSALTGLGSDCITVCQGDP